MDRPRQELGPSKRSSAWISQRLADIRRQLGARGRLPLPTRISEADTVASAAGTDDYIARAGKYFAACEVSLAGMSG